ncbi:MAG: hypothetical protein M1819_001140 [Sarea resinae]|nr:MAG: hypothetical protein M1819_001140 [Sarea resinae]
MTPDAALALISEFNALPNSPSRRQLQALLDSFGIEASTLTVLARLLNRSPREDIRSLAMRLVLSASELNEPHASFTLVNEALKLNQGLTHPELKHAKAHVTDMAHKGHPRAMLLLGRIYEANGQDKLAGPLYEQAASVPLPEDDSHSYLIPTDDFMPWLSLGRFKLAHEDYEGAKEAFSIGIALDEPMAYLNMSYFMDKEDPQYETYLLKAAMAGIPEACHKLGLFYQQESKEVQITKSEQEEKQQRAKSRSRKMLGEEWFGVAFGGGHIKSGIAFALSRRLLGDPDEGYHFLTTTEKVIKNKAPNIDKEEVDLLEVVKYFKDLWDDYDDDSKRLRDGQVSFIEQYG